PADLMQYCAGSVGIKRAREPQAVVPGGDDPATWSERLTAADELGRHLHQVPPGAVPVPDAGEQPKVRFGHDRPDVGGRYDRAGPDPALEAGRREVVPAPIAEPADVWRLAEGRAVAAEGPRAG